MIQMTVESDKTIGYFYGPVGYDWDGFTKTDAVQFLSEAPEDKPIEVRINSEGGSVFDGYAIYSLFRSDSRSITTYIDGLAASIASVVALAGDRVLAATESMFMIHEPWAVAIGDAKEMRGTAARLDAVGMQIAGVYARAGVESIDRYRELMKDETWFTSLEAADTGLIDEVIDEPAQIGNYITTHWKHVPPNIKRDGRATPAAIKRAMSWRLAVIRADDCLYGAQSEIGKHI